jgi:hypothetical protein
MSGYRLTTSRYGSPREAELVLIYVTEPHDRRSWIKDDAAEPPHRVEVLKLAASLKFLTGIYPYSVMTSVFSPVDDYGGPRFQPAKLTLGAQEWCGNWFLAVWPGPASLRALRLSYFASEGERTGTVETGAGAVYEDALLIQLRELDGPFAGGEDWEGPLVPALWEMRRGHADPGAVPVTIARGEAVRAGRPATRFTLRYGDVVRVLDVEVASPRRVLGWTTTRGGLEVERAELLATERLAYWELNAPGDEARRAALGLGTRGYAPPPGDPTSGDSLPGC